MLTEFEKRMFYACLTLMSSQTHSFPWGAGVTRPEQLKAIERTLENLRLPKERPHADKRLAHALLTLQKEGLIEPSETDENGSILGWTVPPEVALKKKLPAATIISLNSKHKAIKENFPAKSLPRNISLR